MHSFSLYIATSENYVTIGPYVTRFSPVVFVVEGFVVVATEEEFVAAAVLADVVAFVVVGPTTSADNAVSAEGASPEEPTD